ncbi:MAG: hypothetical protein EZS28_018792 [Streblomastix strix]|uniref:DM10 domain-containing protein n=1 Tax=Streblomastix strix TaxID=222440 RepID=A0A5J4VTC9_9EUKA|nr:MAG: hypothetical protein EZS28_018792 [Streblomastix strix]
MKPHPRTTITQDPEKHALRQFLRNDRKVLRFYAVLDNRNESFGDMRQFVIQYYLIPKKIQEVVMDEPRTATITAADLMIGRTYYYRTAYGITKFSHIQLPELINIAHESTFLGLTSLPDPGMTYTASKQQIIDVMLQP